jgi:hypothetical protein
MRSALVLASLIVAGRAIAAVGPCPAAQLERPPALFAFMETGGTVRFRTDVPVVGRLSYGDSPTALDTVLTASSAETDHVFDLTGLQADHTYFYSVGDECGNVHAGGDSDHFLRTDPPHGSTSEVKIVSLSDFGWPQENRSNQIGVRDQILQYYGASPPALWIAAGDISQMTWEDVSFSENVFQPMAPMLRNITMYPVPGNHDAVGDPNYDALAVPPTGVYFDSFTLPESSSGTASWWSKDYANIHLVGLNTEYTPIGDPDSEQLSWLAADLAANQQQWTLCFFHRPTHTRSHWSSDAPPTDLLRTVVAPLLESGGCDLVISGHSHAYERTLMVHGCYEPSTDPCWTGTAIVDAGRSISSPVARH